MEITGEKYRVAYHEETATITFQGSLRLQGLDAYASIASLLSSLADQHLETLTLNLHELEFLNSSGINMLSRFVVSIRKQGQTRLIVHGTHQFPWQTKSLKNFERLLPSLQLTFD